MDHKEFDECRCPCHSTPGMKHVVACCVQCPKCGKNIVSLCYDSHVERCQGANLVWELAQLKDSSSSSKDG